MELWVTLDRKDLLALEFLEPLESKVDLARLEFLELRELH
jgi:hypothetical protein